jgi:hypothetical protein
MVEIPPDQVTKIALLILAVVIADAIGPDLATRGGETKREEEGDTEIATAGGTGMMTAGETAEREMTTHLVVLGTETTDDGQDLETGVTETTTGKTDQEGGTAVEEATGMRIGTGKPVFVRVCDAQGA